MALRVSGKNIDIGDALRTHVRERIDAVVTKYSAGSVTGHVTIEPEGSGFRADCTLFLKSGLTLQVEAEAQDPYASFNRAADRIEKRLRRYRQKLHDHHAGNGIDRLPDREIAGVDIDVESVEEIADPGSCPAVIAEVMTCLKEMSVSGAVLELDQANVNVVIFRHSTDGRPHIVYRRSDGNIGWIDTLAAAKSSNA